MKGWSFRATGIEAETSGSRSSSVARRLTAVVLKLRMKLGSSSSAAVSDSFSAAIAPIIWFVLLMKPVMSSERSASVSVSVAVSTMKRSRLASSEESSLKTCREVDRNGFR